MGANMKDSLELTLLQIIWAFFELNDKIYFPIVGLGARGQRVRLLIMESRVRFLSLPQFLNVDQVWNGVPWELYATDLLFIYYILQNEEVVRAQLSSYITGFFVIS